MVAAGVTIHFEGHKGLRGGFHKLFGPHIARARQMRIRFKLIAGGPRTETVADFLRSCRLRPSDLNVLLIDSEGPVPVTEEAIRSLRAQGWWDRSVTCDDSQINLMVQAMESWFVADPKALVEHFGQDFNTGGLPNPQNAESVAPANLVSAIRRCLPQGRRRRNYDKVADGAKLLGLIDADRVSLYCPHFARLRAFLDEVV